MNVKHYLILPAIVLGSCGAVVWFLRWAVLPQFDGYGVTYAALFVGIFIIAVLVATLGWLLGQLILPYFARWEFVDESAKPEGAENNHD